MTSVTDESTEVEDFHKYTEGELSSMTNAQIRQLASDLGYSLKATNKAGLVSEFLEQQG